MCTEGLTICSSGLVSYLDLGSLVSYLDLGNNLGVVGLMCCSFRLVVRDPLRYVGGVPVLGVSQTNCRNAALLAESYPPESGNHLNPSQCVCQG